MGAGGAIGTGPIWAVIPAYNERSTLRGVAEAVLPHVDSVLVVDDGSTDGMGESIADLPVTVVRNEANQGKAPTLWRGLRAARAAGASAVVTLDADGQHPPERIPHLLEAYRQVPDTLVVGARADKREAAPLYRRLSNDFADFWISWAAGRPLVDTQSGFRVYPGELIDRMPAALGEARAFVFESQVLIEASRLGFGVAFVRIPAVYPEGLRPSHYRPLADGLLIVAMVAGKLLRRGLYPRGLYHALRDPRPRVH
ncbi:glycosyltransferase family 2 protein [Ectothiorhodospiraceae bacterium WFHF3C12]|nr:glycosyltransferase family 2 protein [Ectothiorhodospiraceae bacterium WFHF3C12]